MLLFIFYGKKMLFCFTPDAAYLTAETTFPLLVKTENNDA